MQVTMTAGGTADWEKPVRIGADQWRANYQTFLVTRYTFDNGRKVHVKTRYCGVDDVNLDGTVTGGFGHVEGRDEDDDWLFGRVDWEVRGEYEGGIYTFLGGTGKWKDASGEIRAAVYARPEDSDQIMPPSGPIRMYGFIEGTGELSVPNLDS